MSDVPLNGDDIRQYLQEVAEQLGPVGPQHALVIVGGALLALHGLRDSTADVDTVRPFGVELADAIAEVAVRHALAPKWLNASATAFVPSTLVEADCEELLDHPRLRVLGAPFAQVFLMKLRAGRAQDHDDMVRLWALTGFADPDEAYRMFWVAYPSAPDDQHLLDYIKQIADKARDSG